MKKIFLLVVMLPVLMNAQNMTPELLWQLGRVSLDAVSPDGKTVIYGVTTYNTQENKGNRDLFAVTAKGGEANRITSGEGSEYGAQYILNGSKIAYQTGGELYIMNPDGSDVKSVPVAEGAHDLKLFDLPNGKLMLLYSAPEKLLPSTLDLYPNLNKANVKIIDNLMYRHWSYWNDEEFEHLNYAILNPENNFAIEQTRDIMNGEKWDCPVPPFDGNEDYTISPDGKTIVYVAKKAYGKDFSVSTNTDLYQYTIESGETVNLTEGMLGYDKNPSFSPDGKLLAFTSMPRDGFESDVNMLKIMDVASKEVFSLNEVEYIGGFTWADSKTIYFGFDHQATKQIGMSTLNNYGTSKFSVSTSTIASGDYNYGHFEIAGKNIIATRQDMNHANEIYSIDKKGKAKAITHVNDEIYNNIGLSTIEKRMVKTTDGKDMLTWVIYPPNFDESMQYPTLLYCQGGPQSAVSQFYSFRWNFQLMAAQGYIVVAPNRRGVPGFGKEWNEAISKDWGGQAMKDYLSAIDEVAKEPYVNSKKLGAIGASYGGYSVYMLAGIHQGRFSAFISHCGLYNIESWYGSTEELFFANWDIGGAYWEQPTPKSYAAFSPHKYVQHWDTPIMVIHGGKDFRVPENQGMEAFQAAQLKGIPSRFVYFPEEGHWVLSPQNGIIWHDQFFSWLNQWLKQ